MGGNANTAIYDKTVDRAAMIRLHEGDIAKKLLNNQGAHERNVAKMVKGSGGKFDKGFYRELREEGDSAFASSKAISERSLLRLVKNQLDYYYQVVDAAIGKVWRTQRPNRLVSEDIVLHRPLYKDVTLAAGWSHISIGERKRLEQVIRQGISKGLGEKDIAVELMRGSAFKITRNQALGLSRTAITSVLAQADFEVLSANADALEGWQYVAVLDTRTTPVCASRNGKVFTMDQREFLPPAHWHCRSTVTPVVKRYDDLLRLDNVAHIRKRNLSQLTDEQRAFYDGQTPLGESYDAWLRRQPQDVQMKHLGDHKRLQAFLENKLSLDRFEEAGRTMTLAELRKSTEAGYSVSGDTRKFANAKERLEAIRLGAARPEDLLESKELQDALREYYKLQAGDLEGVLSYTNYRGLLIGTKKQTRRRVLNTPPQEHNIRFNPVTNRYEDSRLYQPAPAVLDNNLRLVRESDQLTSADKRFIEDFVDSLSGSMGVNQRAVVADNLRIVFSRSRSNNEPWGNLKAVLNSQMKFDVMNVSDAIETQIRRDADLMQKLKQMQFIDPVLGPQELQDISDGFVDNIFAMRRWEHKNAPALGRKLRNTFDLKIPAKIRMRLDDKDIEKFYTNFVRRLAVMDTPDRDQLAIGLGRELYNSANWRGSRNEWFELGVKILDDAKGKGFFELETFGVQKRRMKSRNGDRYFGPYYDTFSVNVRVIHPDILDYQKLARKVDLGLRLPVTSPKNRLYVRAGYKTYFTHDNRDTGIPITSTGSFSDFPVDLIDQRMADALNWATSAEFEVDEDFHGFIRKLLAFRDDKGRAEHYHDLNHYRKYITERGDSYERFKAMEWLVGKKASFSNHPFLDHRARIYDRGLIGPQSGETFRPFLNTKVSKPLRREGFLNMQDQIGSFLGGLSEKFEGPHDSLTVVGRQRIAEKWRSDMVAIGRKMRRAKPNDIRDILDSPLVQEIEGEEQGKFFRLAIELSKIDDYLGGDFSDQNLVRLKDYKIKLALEQDASSSGAQIIALTTRNKELAGLSNVVPTTQKRRLYDEIAASTFNDPRFIALNERLGLSEIDLRKAAKAQNMVSFYGAGERTGILNVEGKLAKVLGKDKERLVVRAADRDAVLNEISARMARYERFDRDTYLELKQLRKDVKDTFNKGLPVGDDLMEQLYFLDSGTRGIVEKMTRQYSDVVTPDDFEAIAKIMSEHLGRQVPILRDFTRFFGRLAEDFVVNAKPSSSAFDWKAISKRALLGKRDGGKKLPRQLSEYLGLDPNEPIREKVLKRFSWWNPNGTLADLLFGVNEEKYRRTGKKLSGPEIAGLIKTFEADVLYPNKMPKSWTQIPWVNFDGKVIEQHFTQTFEEKLVYRDKDGKVVVNIVQVPQKTEPSWWEEILNKDNRFNDIVDVQKARTAYGVNGNHSNDATLVKRFHLWGRENDVTTATIHDAFFTNAADMIDAKRALRGSYADVVNSNVIKKTLDEMKARGFPEELYNRYMEEAIDIGLIPVAGRSKIGDRVITEDDILRAEDILDRVKEDFRTNRDWYGIG